MGLLGSPANRARHAAVAAVVVLGLSGCLGPSTGLGGDAVPAPAWTPGDVWRYDAHFVGENAYGLDHFDVAFNTTYAVINETDSFRGDPAYYVRTEGNVRLETSSNSWILLNLGRVAAIAREDLRELAWGAGGGGVSFFGPSARCRTALLGEADLNDRHLGFPLQDGQSWNEIIGTQYGTYVEARVLGRESVTVPAGTFDTVHVEEHIQGTTGWTGDPLAERALYTLDVWYGAEARQLVRTSLRWVDDEDPTSRTELRQELRDVMHDESVLEPAPFSEGPPAVPPVRIVTDTAFPVNLADGPVEAAFGLDVAPSAEESSGLDFPLVAASVPLSAPIDHEWYQVVWQFRRPWLNWTNAQGDLVRHEFDIGPRTVVEARVAYADGVCPMGFPDGQAPHAWASVWNAWEKTFVANVTTGPERLVHLGPFLVPSQGAQGSLHWTRTPMLPVGVDAGRPALFEPDGEELLINLGDSEAIFGAQTEGTWTLQWAAEGAALAPGENLPVVVGDDYLVTLRLEFRDI